MIGVPKEALASNILSLSLQEKVLYTVSDFIDCIPKSKPEISDHCRNCPASRPFTLLFLEAPSQFLIPMKSATLR